MPSTMHAETFRNRLAGYWPDEIDLRGADCENLKRNCVAELQ
jgi:hypothetical protein